VVQIGKICLPRGTPLPPRYIGIMGLEENSEKIHGAQQRAGKILLSKDLRPLFFWHLYRLRLDHDGLDANRAQGQMSQRGCGFSGAQSPFAFSDNVCLHGLVNYHCRSLGLRQVDYDALVHRVSDKPRVCQERRLRSGLVGIKRTIGPSNAIIVKPVQSHCVLTIISEEYSTLRLTVNRP
jgi:hypothetical protein